MKRLLYCFAIFLQISLLTGCFDKKNDNPSKDNNTIDNKPTKKISEDISDSLQLFEEEKISATADELFNDFFFSFISDKKFQKQRVGYKMKNQKAEIFERFSTEDYFNIIYDDDKDLSLIQDTSLLKVSVKWIDLENKNIDSYNFNKIDGLWILTDEKQDSVFYKMDSSFFDFYSKFTSNIDFQKESLSDTLNYKATPETDEDDWEYGEITKDDWEEFSMEMPTLRPTVVLIDYGQKIDGHKNAKNVLFEAFSSGNAVIYRFDIDHASNEWKLCEINL